MSDVWKPEEPVFTVPNVIALARLAGLIPMLWVAHAGHREAFFVLMVVLMASDWADGKLAVLLDQRTVLGARLDSAADWLMYAAIGVGLWWLEAGVIRSNALLIAGVGATWGLSAAIALARFRRLPSYHNRGAKASWLLAALAAVLLFLADTAVLIPWAFVAVIVTILEAAAIGVVLPEWRANVAS
ncbi:MAG: CDP-alcohol phosphatidyltransferase family protein, partial [Longimicrobiales bacterium]|nr:CDP-alcohol phosphatidyltransferase family protein [Longimicrobiales bacterium]